MSSLVPNRKVTSGALAGAVTVILGFVSHRLGLDLPEDVTAALTVLISMGTAYLVPEGSDEEL